MEGIKPAWEDRENKDAYIFAFNYEVKDNDRVREFLESAKKIWNDLTLSLIGGLLPGCEYVLIFNFRPMV